MQYVLYFLHVMQLAPIYSFVTFMFYFFDSLKALFNSSQPKNKLFRIAIPFRWNQSVFRLDPGFLEPNFHGRTPILFLWWGLIWFCGNTSDGWDSWRGNEFKESRTSEEGEPSSQTTYKWAPSTCPITLQPLKQSEYLKKNGVC